MGRATGSNSLRVSRRRLTHAQCDVLVAGFDPKALRSVGTGMVQQLWANDVSAELAVDARSTEELLAHYREDKHSWIIIIKQDTGSGGERALKVKNMLRKEDSDIRSSELLSWLRSEIRERDQREGMKDRARLIRHASQPDSSTSTSDNRAQDVRLLVRDLPLGKTKKPNRRAIIEAGWS